MDYTANRGRRVAPNRERMLVASAQELAFPRSNHDRQTMIAESTSSRSKGLSSHATGLRGQHEPREGSRQAIRVAVPVRAEQSAWELSSSALQRRVGPAEQVHPTSRCTRR
jgi:hypothetical protein